MPTFEITARGVQCPTAPVQKIKVVEYQKNCCGKLVPVLVEKAPSEGDSEFVQCRCSEKQASDAHATASTPKFILFLDVPSALQDRRLLEAGSEEFAYQQRLQSVKAVPLTPPPQNS